MPLPDKQIKALKMHKVSCPSRGKSILKEDVFMGESGGNLFHISMHKVHPIFLV